MNPAIGILLLGFVLGLRHATDPDHVVAVSTIVSRERSIFSAAIVGMAWGLGHTLTVFLAGGALILFRLTVPPRLGLSLEFCVALMLVGLGLLNLRSKTAPHEHIAPREGRVVLRLARPVAIGVVHGFAGSAAIALLVLTTIHDTAWALLYLLLFGGGTVAGMMLLTSTMAVPFALQGERFAGVNRRMVQLTSVASIGLGLFLAYRVGITDGLFSATPRWTPS